MKTTTPWDNMSREDMIRELMKSQVAMRDAYLTINRMTFDLDQLRCLLCEMTGSAHESVELFAAIKTTKEWLN